MELKSCRICRNENLKKFFDLGKQPLANSLPSKPLAKENRYPLALSWCPNCNLVQLNYTVDPKKLFSKYVWVTGTSATTRKYAEQFCHNLIKRTNNPRKGYVLEIASNDGTFLKPFMNKKYKVLGIDPAKNVAKMANGLGVPTRAEFWGVKTAQKLLMERGPARMIFARNVMFHVADIENFIQGLVLALDNDGTLAAEIHYAKIVQEQLHYDSIYHEHLFYYSIKSFERLLNTFGLYVFDIEKSPISGGSIVVYAKRKKTKESPVVEKYRHAEKRDRTNDIITWRKFAKRCYKHKLAFQKFIKDARHISKNIAGWGASARSSTMLNFCRINSKILPAIIDLNPLKQGKFTAGTRIPIKPADVVMHNKPNCLVILAWNFAQEIIDILKNKYNFKGKCIIPLPDKPKLIKI